MTTVPDPLALPTMEAVWGTKAEHFLAFVRIAATLICHRRLTK
ncbi:hypothetical protein OG501_08885 [Streptomyces niveus]